MALEQVAPKLGAVMSELQLVIHNAQQKPPETLLCFDLLTKLLGTLENEPKDSLLALQRRSEDTLQTLLLLGSPPPIRRLASAAMVRLIEIGDSISIYSRVSSLQGLFADKTLKPIAVIGAAQCLGALSRHHGLRIMSGLAETVGIIAKLVRASEVGVRLAAMQLLHDAVEGMRGGGPVTAYTDAVKTVTRYGAVDRAPLVRAAAGNCLRAIAVAGGPGLAGGGIEPLASLCVKALDDAAQPVRDSFAAALGSLIALGLNPQAQIQGRGKGPPVPAKLMEGGLQKYLILQFSRASGPRSRDIRMGLAIAWVSFLQGMRLNYGLTDLELPIYAQHVIGMLSPAPKSMVDVHAQACVMYILRVGIVEQMGEAAQRELLKTLIKQLSPSDSSPSMLIVTLRTLSHLLRTLGEVSQAAREGLDESLLACLCHPSAAVRVEAALTLRALAEVDPSCASGLLSCGVVALRTMRESVASDKKGELDGLHGQTAMLAALLVAAPNLPLGVPSRLPLSILSMAQQMVLHPECQHPASAAAEREAGWMLIGALVSMLPKEELEAHELEFIALWTVPFGGNCLERLKKVETAKLPSEISGWAAAMEALAAFIQSYVVPNMSAQKESLLLSPVLGNLNAALTCISSPTLLEGSAAVRSQAELLVVHTLHAYLALPDPLLYKTDHEALLALCTSPFRDGSAFPASSCLRQLLDPRDAALGPWIPGRDSLEDELRAFRGGSDGLLPRTWDTGTPLFPQPLSQATSLVDSMLLCFCSVFPVRPEQSRLDLLEVIINCLKAGRKQPWRAANAVNVCVALLGSLKHMIGMRDLGEPSAELWKRCQMVVQGILAADASAPGYKRAAAEALGMLGRLGDDLYTARLVRSLLVDAENTNEASQKGAIALALGCVRRSVGGMALSTLVSPSVQLLCKLARDSSDGLHIWALHALWLTADAAGLSYIPHVQATLSLAMDVLLSEEHNTPGLYQSVGRLVNAMVAVLGPELVPGSSVFSRCKAIVSDISSAQDPAAQLECVLYTQQLVLFAPQAVPLHVHVGTLRATLSSRQPSLRQAAISTLRHMSEREPAAMADEHIEEDLFAMLDTETNERIVRDVCLTLERLLEAACPSNPSRWLRLCRNVVLAASATKKAGEDLGDKDSHEAGHTEDDEAGMVAHTARLSVDQRAGNGQEKASDKGNDSDQLPRFRTRFFAAECLSRLPSATGDNPAHFDLVLARDERQASDGSGEVAGDWLVAHLAELVALAYQVATGTLETVRPMGVSLLSTVLDKFGHTEDPEYEAHLLLEQYQAQLLSTVRAAFDSSGGPLLKIAGAQLAAKIVTSGVAGGERVVLQRIISLISGPVSQWDKLSNSSYAEWVGCKVRIELLTAHARVKRFALTAHDRLSAPSPRQPSSKDAQALATLLQQSAPQLPRYWAGVLRDYAVARSQPPAVQKAYSPFLRIQSSAAATAIIRPYLDEAWAVIFEALTLDAQPKTLANGELSNGQPPLTNGHGAFENGGGGPEQGLEDSDFHQLWGLALSVLCERAAEQDKASQAAASGSSWGRAREGHEGDPTQLSREEERLVALKALRSLASEAFYQPELLSVELCLELLQVLLDVEVAKHPPLQAAVVAILEQVVTAVPDEYLQNSDFIMAVAELGIAHLHRLLVCESAGAGRITTTAEEEEAALVTVMHAMASFSSRLDAHAQAVLLPQLLCAALRALGLAPATGPVLPAAAALATGIASLGQLKGAGVDLASTSQRASVLASATESLAQMVDRLISDAARRASQLDSSASADVPPSPRTPAGRQVSASSRRTSFDTGPLDPTPSPRADRQASMSGRKAGALDASRSDSFSERLGLAPGSRRNSLMDGPDADPETSQRLPTLLGVMSAIAPAIPEVPGENPEEQPRTEAYRRCWGCMRTALTSSTPGVQMAALQLLRNLLQTAAGEAAADPRRIWALLCMRQLAGAITGIVYSACQGPAMTTAVANGVMESLKLLLLLHTLAEGEERQRAVLAVLLPTAIAAAAPRSVPGAPPSPAPAALVSLVVRIVQRFATSSAAQLQAVAAALPGESKAQLQAIIRASTSSQPETAVAASSAAARASGGSPIKQQPPVKSLGLVPPPRASGLAPPPLPGFLAPPPRLSPVQPRPPPVALVSGGGGDDDDDDDDDDWDDFQSQRAANTPATQAVPASVAPPPTAQGSAGPAASAEAADLDDSEWDAFQNNQSERPAEDAPSSIAPSGNLPVAEAKVAEEDDEDDDWDDFQGSTSGATEASPVAPPVAHVAQQVASSISAPSGQQGEEDAGDWGSFKGPPVSPAPQETPAASAPSTGDCGAKREEEEGSAVQGNQGGDSLGTISTAENAQEGAEILEAPLEVPTTSCTDGLEATELRINQGEEATDASPSSPETDFPETEPSPVAGDQQEANETADSLQAREKTGGAEENNVPSELLSSSSLNSAASSEPQLLEGSLAADSETADVAAEASTEAPAESSLHVGSMKEDGEGGSTRT